MPPPSTMFPHLARHRQPYLTPTAAYKVHSRTSPQAHTRPQALQCHVGRPSHARLSQHVADYIPGAGFIDESVHTYSKDTITFAFEFIHEAPRWTLSEGGVAILD